MHISDSRFIQETTQCLYSNLNIETSLFSVFNYLKQFFPMTMAHIFIYDNTRDSLRYLAMATEKRGFMIDETIKVSGRAKAEFQGHTAGGVYGYTKSRSILIQEIYAHFQQHTRKRRIKKDKDFSCLSLVLDIDIFMAGGFSIMAEGTDRYTEAHKRRLRLLGNVIKGSILNLLHHREIVSLNERLVREKDALRKQLGHNTAVEVIGAESGLKEVMALARRVAPTSTPVLMSGETGVGKELIAHVIHKESNRHRGPFICVNCGAIPETLVDSELFGHEKGAFTGAVELKRGYFEQANGGTIFLDEVGELPPPSQVRFLRVLQTMEFQRVGGQRPISLDVRVIAATNRDLPAMVRNNQFREDLWFRLSVFPIKIPALRDRSEDIPEMARYFAFQKTFELNRHTRPSISREAMGQLIAYDWPGNIRELQNVIERALIISNGENLVFPSLIKENPVSLPLFGMSETAGFPTMDEMTIRLIKKALTVCGGRINGKGGAAQLLGMNPSTLRGRMRKYGIETTRIPQMKDQTIGLITEPKKVRASDG